MKIFRRLLMGAASVALVGGTLATVAPAGASTTTVDVSNASVTCGSVTGSLKFSTPLKLTNPTTGPLTQTWKGTVTGCTSSTVNSGNSVFSGTVTATFNSSSGTNCTALLGLQSEVGSITVVWKAPKGYAFTPTQTINAKVVPASVVSTTQAKGAQFGVSGQGPWTSSYGQIEIGTAYGTAQTAVTGANQDFTGGDNGHGGWLNSVFGIDSNAGLAACSGSGLKSVTFGIGAFSLS